MDRMIERVDERFLSEHNPVDPDNPVIRSKNSSQCPSCRCGEFTMPADFPNSELEAYLDEALPIEQMAAIEEALRGSDDLQKRLAAVNGRRDAGVHSLGDIWR